MFTNERKKLLARAFVNYSVVTFASLVINQFALGNFSLLTLINGLAFSSSWLLTALIIEPEKEVE